ncbi:IclR family transcriptional regulator [Nocardioides sp. DS6]|uniref:IclR family transcriptional regulator n=1 Tax=Nocardioides eburneus TaxID=3231482 RepID=A0ABV3SZV1_9ACTN
MTPTDTTGAAPVQSVDRAVRVLEILARDGDVAAGEIARELGVHGSTVSRLIASLSAHGLVERNGVNGGFRLGVGLLRLAGATASRLDLTGQAQPVCDALAAELDETTNVAILSDGVAINVCQAAGSNAVATQNWVGRRTVLHATSSGKVLLAYLDEDDLAALLQRPLERFTPHTITTVRALRAQLREVRETGYATAVEEYEEGLNAVAAPVRGPDGSVIAAISAAGPAYRLGPDDLPATTDAVIRAAQEISRRMGHHP